jgi:hypothetical protein
VVAVRRVARFLLLVIAAAAFAGVLPAHADAQDSLTGESFLGGTTFFPDGEPVDVQASCNPEGVSTITYSASGLAFGPYTGTYEETGTVKIGPHELEQFFSGGFEAGPLVHVEVRFKIFSAAGFVTGTKSLPAESVDAIGACYDIADDLHVRAICACALSLSYDAVISSELGLFRDEGRSGFILHDFTVIGPFNLFNESFASDGLTPLESTPGLATGGGQILSTSPGVTFGFEARSDGETSNGHCDVVDHLTGQHVVCLDVDTYVQVDNSAFFYGDAIIDGESARYRIEVVDNAESGIGQDFFGIVVFTEVSYVREGILTEGDIEVHPQASS